MENEQIDAMSKLLKSMSHPIRLKILIHDPRIIELMGKMQSLFCPSIK